VTVREKESPCRFAPGWGMLGRSLVLHAGRTLQLLEHLCHLIVIFWSLSWRGASPPLFRVAVLVNGAAYSQSGSRGDQPCSDGQISPQ
jgi:hypothetical protein